ncbi:MULTISPECIES: DUF4440 domain-containing protein [unclassified Pseudovibrio]|uniref:nuclear transport factor 2 family protein n=1 Tax=unclassified Pseudovibrio TaxID=2627060 RepID=UPI0007AEE037|nr:MULTISPECIES: DUF4440 domain-containing protein [unclassified Pseudovibrio]
MDRSQIALLRYAGHFTSIYALFVAVFFAFMMLNFIVWEVELPLHYVDWIVVIICGERVGQTIYKRNATGLEGVGLYKLSGLCLLGIVAIDIIFTLLAILVDSRLEWIPKTAVEYVFSIIFPAIFIFWMIWFGFKWGFRTAEQKAAKRAAKAVEQSLFDLLLTLENQLLDPVVRRTRKKLEQLLHVDFAEIGASGRMYDRRQILDELPAEAHDYPTRTIEGFHIRELSEGLVQVFYDIAENGTRRTSIWMFAGHQWRMIYHQGTRRAS